MTRRTLTIIKPDAVQQGVVGEVISAIEKAKFRTAAARMVHLTKAEAEGFYAVHRERPFFDSLTSFMSSGPCIPMVLEAEDAIARLRALMGATDPAKADQGTTRKRYATSVERNIIHGSDAPETAVAATHEGDARVSAYTVVHDRDGRPDWALLVCDLPDGMRTYAQVRSPEACERAETDELIGTTVRLRPESRDGPMGTATVNVAAM